MNRKDFLAGLAAAFSLAGCADTSPTEIARLIDELGSKNFKKREEATPA